MQKIILPIMILVASVFGAYAATTLKSNSDGTPAKKADSGGHTKPEGHEKKADSHGKEEKKAHGKAKASTSEHGDSAASSDEIYFKFSREFVVPVMESSRVKSLVIININLEADSDMSDKLFAMEPKLRDNIMTTLVGLSNDGMTLEGLTDVESYETIRSTILFNLQSVISTGIRNVLILDMAKQDL